MISSSTVNQRKSPRRKSVHEVNPTKLTEIILTDVDWEDFNREIRLFNEGKFWHAHEAWEQVWRRHPEDSELFIQGLIQMAAAFHLLIDKRRYSGAASKFNRALERLRLFEPNFLNLPVTGFTKPIEGTKDEIQKLENKTVTALSDAITPTILLLQKYKMV
jgi:hypothetical protein